LRLTAAAGAGNTRFRSRTALPARFRLKMNWFIAPFRQYDVFSGRACRREFWGFTLGNALAHALLWLGRWLAEDNGETAAADVFKILVMLQILGATVPGAAVLVRRLHDTGRNGWWALLSIPSFAAWWTLLGDYLWRSDNMFILVCAMYWTGPAVLLIFTTQRGEHGSNIYGENPRWVRGAGKV